MSSPVTTRVKCVTRQSGRVGHHGDHSGLYDPGSSWTPWTAPQHRRDAPDAIIVPASRPASAIEPLIDLAADLGSELVVLCSHQASVAQVAERMERRLGARGVVATVDRCPEPVGVNTGGEQFLVPNGERRSDLSAKRNTGLLLARLRGWKKIVFVDDDITLDPNDVPRMARQLDKYAIVGMRCTSFADNSVLCHARRLAKIEQGVFVTGAVLGVNIDAPDLAFFPDIYNEDWFFFGEAAAGRRLPKPCHAEQKRYDPYTRNRARREEFGDLLAEGLYALIESSGLDAFHDVVDLATRPFWDGFIEDRVGAIDAVRDKLRSYEDRDACGDDVPRARRALEFARTAYTGASPDVTAERCVEFLDGWRLDTASWREKLPTVTSARSDEAMAELGATDATPVRLPVSV